MTESSWGERHAWRKEVADHRHTEFAHEERWGIQRLCNDAERLAQIENHAMARSTTIQTELVERLRGLASHRYSDWSVADEAADEIERLRRELVTLRRDIDEALGEGPFRSHDPL